MRVVLDVYAVASGREDREKGQLCIDKVEGSNTVEMVLVLTSGDEIFAIDSSELLGALELLSR